MQVYQRVAWITGNLGLGVGLIIKSRLFHSATLKENERLKEISTLQMITSLSQIVLSGFLAQRNGGLLATGLMLNLAGSFLFYGIVYYQTLCDDLRFRKLVPLGGGLLILSYSILALN